LRWEYSGNFSNGGEIEIPKNGARTPRQVAGAFPIHQLGSMT